MDNFISGMDETFNEDEKMMYDTGNRLINLAAEKLGELGFQLTAAGITEIGFPRQGYGPQYRIEITVKPPHAITCLENPSNKKSRRRSIDHEKLSALMEKGK